MDQLLGPPMDEVSFTIDYIYFDYPSADNGEDFWIDEFRITSSPSPEGQQLYKTIHSSLLHVHVPYVGNNVHHLILFIFIVTQSIKAARPNNVPIDSIQVTKKSVELECPDNGGPTDCYLQIPFTIKYTVENCVHGIPLTTTTGDHVTVTRLYTGSPPVEGTFNVSFEGKSITGLSAMMEEEEMKQVLETGFGSVFDVDRSGSCHGYYWDIRWENRGGDLPLMSIEGSDLTGDSPTIEVTPVTDGGVWFRPFRGDMLRLPELHPQVSIIIL